MKAFFELDQKTMLSIEKNLNARAKIKYLFENKFSFQIGLCNDFIDKAKKIESIESAANIIVLTSSIFKLNCDKNQ